MTAAFYTRWRVTRIAGESAVLNVLLTVDTVAPFVVRAIETAAASHGIELEREIVDEYGPTGAYASPETP